MLPFKQSLLLLVALSTCHGSPSSTTEYGVPKYLPAPPGMTPSCAKNGETYCEDIDTYPKNLIQRLIDRKKYIFDTFFRNLLLPRVHGHLTYHHKRPISSTKPFQHTTFDTTFQHYGNNTIFFNQTQDEYYHSLNNISELNSALPRTDLTANELRRRRYQGIQSIQDPFPICNTTAQDVNPKAARTPQGIWKYVVNQGANSNYSQYVSVKTCKSRNSNCCREDIFTLPNGYNGTCKQKYVIVHLLALSEDGEILYPDKFEIPHCCLCMIKYL